MAKVKKKEISEEIKLLKTRVVTEKKAVIGTERVLKELRTRKLQKVFLASNCPDKIKKDVQYYAQLAEVPVMELKMDNEELGVFCKKNFFVSVIGIY